MKILFLFLASTLVLWAAKPLPPGAGASIKPNVLFVVDNSGSMRGTRMTQSKAALQLLLNDNNITSSIRLGLSQFPNQSWGCGNDRRQLLVPVTDATSAHLSRTRTAVTGLRASGGTPLGNALRHSRYYFKGQSSTYNLSYYPVAEAGSPVIHRCQRNYVIIFTDGGECCHCSSWSGRASAEASALYNSGLSGFTINGNSMEYPEIPVYAIGFHGVNVNYIAQAGGTGSAYNANDQAGLLRAFQQIVRDIGAKNVTATTPTLVPGFTGPEKDVVYMSKFVPREDKQWTGHLYKYRLGSGTNVLSTPVWDLHETIKANIGSSRVVKTICKDDNSTITDFTLGNSEVLASCMVVNAGTGAGNPVEVCNTTAGTWEDRTANCQGWTPVFGDANLCNPRREALDPICVGVDYFIDRARNDPGQVNDTCSQSDFSIYSGGNCNGNSQHDATLVQRYKCQKNEIWCGCFKPFPLNRQFARSCTNSSHCGGAPNSCYRGFCVGEEQHTNDSTMWDPQSSPNYAHNIVRDKMTIGTNNNNYNRVEIHLQNLNFHQAGNASQNLRDYLVVKEYAHTGTGRGNPSTDLKYHAITRINNKLVSFNCPEGYTPPGVGSNRLDVRGCNVEELSGSSLTRVYNTHAVDLIFHSNNTQNAAALQAFKAFRVRTADVINCHWEAGGNGGITRAEAELKEVRRLINFYRGRDSFQEDNILANPDVCAQSTVGTCPSRLYPLADIYNSRTKYLGTPNQFYTYAGYEAFRQANNATDNTRLVLVGSNGGMLHAVHTVGADAGKEGWSFIPPNLLSALKEIRVGVNCVNGNCTSPDLDKTASQFFVDAAPKIMDVCNGPTCATSGANWQTVVIVAFGEGGEGLMALNVTDHLNPVFLWAILNETPHIYESPLYNTLNNCGSFKRIIFWNEQGERTAYSNIPGLAGNGDTALAAGDIAHDYSNLSKTWSEPIIAQIGGTDALTGTFVAVFGGGGIESNKVVRDNNDPNLNLCTNNENFGSSVYAVDIFSGLIINRYDLPTDAGADAIPARVPALLSVLPKANSVNNGTTITGIENRITNQIYVGDISGAVWRLDIRTAIGAVDCASSSRCTKLIDMNSDNVKENYIYQAVAITYDKKTRDDDANIWAYFGTGNTSIHGISRNIGVNHLVAVKDPGWRGDGQNTGLPVSLGSLTDITNGDPRDNNSSCDPTNGWRFSLPTAFKLVGRPVIVDGYVYFTVYHHGVDNDTSECSGHLGTSYLYSFKLFSGCYNEAFKNDPTNDQETNNVRAYLGKGVATSPVVRGNSMYFGISGDGSTDTETPIYGQAERQGNIIKWDRPNINDPNSKSEKVPFSFFRELY